MVWRSLNPGLIALALCAACVRAQDATPPPSKPGVVLTKLGPITYPEIAKRAHISGDVTVELEIARDGTIQSATAVGGPALLYQAARESAQQSEFECRDCTDELTTYRLLYSFRLVEPELPSVEQAECFKTYKAHIAPSVVLVGNHVSFKDSAEVYSECIVSFRVRSWKCLYFWRCGSRL